MTAPVHAETCPYCSGSGSAGYSSGTGSILCPRCHGSGRVPVPMRGITDPDEADEREAELERKMASAISILKLIAKHDSSEGRLAASALAILEA